MTATPGGARSATVRPMAADDWPAVRAIWAEGIATGHATFEEVPPSWHDFDTTRRPDLRFVAVVDLAAGAGPGTTPTDGDVAGWVAVTPVSSRPAYRGVVEHSVYVTAGRRGLGLGRALLIALIDAAPRAGVWTLQSAIFPENTASLALHLDVGFRQVGVRERIGAMTYGPEAGRWRDTVLVERRLGLPDRVDADAPAATQSVEPPPRPPRS